MRVALAQYHPAPSLGANLDLISQIMEHAGQAGVDLVVFAGDFLGYDPAGPEAVAGKLRELAKQFNVEVLTGRVKMDDGVLAQAALIGRDGHLVDRVPEGEVKPLRPCLGTTLVFTEEQSYNAEADKSALQFRPKVMVMQAAAISLLELEAIKELAIDRSYNQAHLVISISAVGHCRDDHCLGSTMAVLQGRILAEADTDASELVIFSVDPALFIDYDELRDPVTIPELLKQKYHPHIHHETDSP